MKKLLILGAALLATYSGLASASVVNVLASNGVFAGNTATDLVNVEGLNDTQIASNLSDGNQATYLFGSDVGATTAGLSLSFDTTVYNQAGADIAFYFVGDGVAPKTNSIGVCFTAACDPLSTTIDATVITGYGVNIGGILVDWSVVTIDLSDFGFADGAALGEFNIDLLAGGYNRLASIESLNSVTVVPVPAAVWLFISGILAMFGFSRRSI